MRRVVVFMVKFVTKNRHAEIWVGSGRRRQAYTYRSLARQGGRVVTEQMREVRDGMYTRLHVLESPHLCTYP